MARSARSGQVFRESDALKTETYTWNQPWKLLRKNPVAITISNNSDSKKTLDTAQNFLSGCTPQIIQTNPWQLKFRFGLACLAMPSNKSSNVKGFISLQTLSICIKSKTLTDCFQWYGWLKKPAVSLDKAAIWSITQTFLSQTEEKTHFCFFTN